MKIYTKTGDQGETGLYAGARVRKDDPRIDAIGSLDELNSWLGWVIAQTLPEELVGRMTAIQSRLFELGAELASLDPTAAGTATLQIAAVQELEGWIDEAEATLPPLKTFILPGGSPAGAALHVARTVCRRAERELTRLQSQPDVKVRPHVLPYLNRLADLLFVWARWVNHHQGSLETPWRPPTVVQSSEG